MEPRLVYAHDRQGQALFVAVGRGMNCARIVPECRGAQHLTLTRTEELGAAP
jgi:hypothetical protein